MNANLLILASGSGSNAENIANHFANHDSIHIRAIGANKSTAYVLERANKLNIESFVFTKSDLGDPSLAEKWKEWDITHIILAGFLLKIPTWLIKSFPDKIINIHPALLPKYGGKGMFGHHVHKAVKNHGEIKTGITIHLVNENYDEGKIIFQAECPVLKGDTPDSIAKKVHALEYQHFPQIIEDYISSNQPLS
jgi:phosphoribosylglycinamide formyltransferase-1